jgi:hypothetical protein
MHASHARLWQRRPARFAGNRVFPNGYIDVALALPPRGRARLVILGDAGAARRFQLTVDGHTTAREFSAEGEFECDVAAATPESRTINVRIQKLSATYPAIFGLGVRKP